MITIRQAQAIDYDTRTGVIEIVGHRADQWTLEQIQGAYNDMLLQEKYLTDGANEDERVMGWGEYNAVIGVTPLWAFKDVGEGHTNSDGTGIPYSRYTGFEPWYGYWLVTFS